MPRLTPQQKLDKAIAEKRAMMLATGQTNPKPKPVVQQGY